MVAFLNCELLARDLVQTVESVLGIARSSRNLQQVMECLAVSESSFVLSNDPARLLIAEQFRRHS